MENEGVMKKKLIGLSEEELIQLVEAYSQKMDNIMNEDDDEIQCEKVYAKYIEVYEQLLAMNFDKYAEKIMQEYYNFAEFYFNFTEHGKKGINALKKRLEICKKLAETRPDYVGELEISYNELGDQYDGLGYIKKANEMYSLAEEMETKRKNI